MNYLYIFAAIVFGFMVGFLCGVAYVEWRVRRNQNPGIFHLKKVVEKKLTNKTQSAM